jgi:hypothetical protein
VSREFDVGIIPRTRTYNSPGRRVWTKNRNEEQ